MTDSTNNTADGKKETLDASNKTFPRVNFRGTGRARTKWNRVSAIWVRTLLVPYDSNLRHSRWWTSICRIPAPQAGHARTCTRETRMTTFTFQHPRPVHLICAIDAGAHLQRVGTKRRQYLIALAYGSLSEFVLGALRFIAHKYETARRRHLVDSASRLATGETWPIGRFSSRVVDGNDTPVGHQRTGECSRGFDAISRTMGKANGWQNWQNATVGLLAEAVAPRPEVLQAFFIHVFRPRFSSTAAPPSGTLPPSPPNSRKITWGITSCECQITPSSTMPGLARRSDEPSAARVSSGRRPQGGRRPRIVKEDIGKELLKG
eukprot:1194410-Prorocentrum_minimum.AAC.3